MWTCAAFVAVAAVVTAWLVIVAAPRERESSAARWRNQLTAMAEDREGAVENYVAERLEDAGLVAGFPTVVGVLAETDRQSLHAPHDDGRLAHLTEVLRLVATRERYCSAVILAADGRVLASAGEHTATGAMASALPRRCQAERRQLADLYLDETKRALLQVTAPVAGPAAAPPIGVVVLTAEAESWLYPFLRHQAVLSDSAEALLVRRDGDDALFLSPLRHRTDAPMTLRRRLAEPASSAAAALAGQTAFHAYQDYRGVPVFAATRQIAGTEWGLVVKVDRFEALAGYRRWLGRALAQLGALVVALAGIAFGVWHRQRSLLHEVVAASERRLGELVQQANDSVFVLSPDGRVLQANRRAEEMYGYSQEELRRLTVADLRAKETREGAREAVWQAAQGSNVTFETINRRRDGSEFPVEVSTHHTEVRGERFLLATVRDLTAHKRAEQGLRESEARFRNLIEDAPLAINITRGTEITYANPAYLRMFGISSLEELKTYAPLELFTPECRPRVLENIERRAKGLPVPDAYEAECFRKDGSRFPILMYLTRTTLPAGPATVTFALDISERKCAEDALRESEVRYRTLFEQSPVGIYRTTPDGRILLANPAMLRMLEYDSVEELISRNLETTGFEPDYPRERFKEHFELHDELMGFEAIWTTRSGKTVHVVENARAIRGADGRVLYYEGAVEDVTARKAAEEAHRRLATAVEQAAEAVVITDHDGVIQYVNPAFEWITGYRAEEVIGANPRILKSGRQDPSFYAEMWRTISEGSVWLGRLSNRRKDGTLYEEEMSISPVRDERGEVVSFVAVKRDVTREVALQEQLIQAQKMEAVGKLAGGIAHDFNNLLQAIMSHVGVLRHPLPAAHAPARSLDELDQLVRRGAALTRQLLLFSRREVARPERLDVNEVIREATSLLRRLVREDVVFSLELTGEALPVEADRGQLDQVLMNLVVNASDAMPDGGRLVIRSGRGHAAMVWFEVEDTGQGIPDEIREHIFEPFFTTKGARQGTGLGLSVVHGIIARHGGSITVTTRPAAGTTFRVTLPRTFSGEFSRVSEHDGAAEELPRGNGERVLVVEDETSAREGLAQILDSLGYEVTSAGTGEEAGTLPAEKPFDLLLTDLMLPGITGAELAVGLKDRWPGLVIILMSGYAEDEALRQGAVRGTEHFLQKPFDIKTLAFEVRTALDEAK